ncbi:MAG TPA: hypothetical protein PLX69_25045 [Leptospiraceae bacterium]|nr:hypothetical protein [Leptospiraceae bacterium]HRG77851.1 hypothetical protein [Leptospiraceae bacterium]
MNLYMETQNGIMQIDDNTRKKVISKYRSPHTKNWIYYIPAKSFSDAEKSLKKYKKKNSLT